MNAAAVETRRTFYPKIEPRRAEHLDTGLHQVYFEESGNPAGKPVIFIHGGPGAATSPIHRRFFDPDAYRIVLFDERGCGKSTPHAELRENTTWDLIADMERIRETLGIDKWMVFGGSWGSTLGLAYAITHPDRVSELIVRGIFMVRQVELDWLYQSGLNALFPDLYERFVAPIPKAERGDMLGAYHRRLTGDDRAVALECAKAWSVWEGGTITLLPDEGLMTEFAGDDFALALARIEVHYFINKAFFETDAWLLENVGRIRGISGAIVQGRYDAVTPVTTAWALHKAWPEAAFTIVPDAGHAQTEPGITDALVRTTDRFRP
jgi:proline iminopeptidase